MKVFLLSPNKEALFTQDDLERLKSTCDLQLQDVIVSFDQVKGLFDGDDERIFAIDPDFNNWEIPNDVLDKIPHLKAVVLQTTSFSWIDVDYLASKDIPVINLRDFSTIAVAEWATTMMMNVARKMPLIIKDGWQQNYDNHQGIELRGKTVGIVGLGNIGTAIAENCVGLGMNVQYWSRSSRDERFNYVELEELMNSSDVVFPVVAQNDYTEGLITDSMILSMKETAMLISIVHHVYNHELLLEQVAAEKLYGYGFEEAGADFNSYKGNVWAGPELAWCTKDSFRKNGQQWVSKIIDAVNGKFDNRVN